MPDYIILASINTILSEFYDSIVSQNPKSNIFLSNINCSAINSKSLTFGISNVFLHDKNGHLKLFKLSRSIKLYFSISISLLHLGHIIDFIPFNLFSISFFNSSQDLNS